MATDGPQLPSQVKTEAIASASKSNGASGVPSKAPKLRKRTKTGCLTCRKRRIKCGEERPTCGNCIKSKRHCEGYNQRVIFKPPIGDWPNAQQAGASTIPFHTAQMPSAQSAFHHSQQVGQLQNTSFTPLRPRVDYGPLTGNGRGLATDFRGASSFDVNNWPYGNGTGIHPSQAGRFPETPFSDGIAASAAQYGRAAYQTPSVPLGIVSPTEQHHPQQKSSYSAGVPVPSYAQGPILSEHGNSGLQQALHYAPHAQHPQPYVQMYQFPKLDESRNPTIFGDVPSQASVSLVEFGLERPREDLAERQYGAVPPPVVQQDEDAYKLQQRQAINFFLNSNHAYESTTREQSQPRVQPTNKPLGDRLLPHDFAAVRANSTQLLEAAAVENEDDDYYDVQSDEEMEDVHVGDYMVSGHGHQPNISMMLALHRESISDLSMRRYDAFIYAGILDHYRAEWVANPLRNPQTARVFAHFVYATGPMISIFERNPRNSSAMFSESPIPNTQQSLWTYTLPMMALNHQGLLHAMLAIASLHIARLQGASTTPSYKHYAYALKRIHHCVGHPKKRHLVTTFAASLLLGYYEVVTADHLKWSSHLIGASQLVQEIDYVGMTKEYRRVEAERGGYDRQFAFENPDMLLNPRQLGSSSRDSSLAIDEELVGTLIGKKLRYDEFGRVLDESDTRRTSNSLPEPLDTTKYELYQDLFWWYCRQDVYRSVLSGNKLLMDYSKWSDCPPRARMGKLDAVYGTHDHLLLVLGRIADFAARDRRRKIKAIESNGGVWRPSADFLRIPRPGADGQRPPAPTSNGAPQSSPRDSQAQGTQMPSLASPLGQGPPGHSGPPQPPQMPSFYGMAPSIGAGHMPSPYATSTSQPSPTDPRNDDIDLKAATATALEEWSQIQAALHTLGANYGPHFRPLSAEYARPQLTPFGEALHYRSYDIGVSWALYYMCQIILTRSHPAMPPAAMMAAGVAAAHTAHFANGIGRIAAGIIPTPATQPLNPSLGAALVEATMPLFFAGVQYVDAAQRAWLVARIAEVEARTGWASAGLIARGCETAWVRAAEAGRGPGYTRVLKRESSDERVSRIRSEDRGEPPRDLTDRRFVYVNASTRVHWAMGILSAEEDVRRIEEL